MGKNEYEKVKKNILLKKVIHNWKNSNKKNLSTTKMENFCRVIFEYSK